jgi:hypothetical protein
MASVVLTGDTSGSGTITVPAVAGTFTATMGSATGTHFPFTAGTAVASTSGTSIDFTSIPSWVKRVTIMFAGVSTTGTSNLIIQSGSGAFETSGYAGSVDSWGTAVGATLWNGAGFQLTLTTSAAQLLNGTAVMTLIGSNVWSFTFTGGSSNSGTMHLSGGAKTFTGTIDRVRITTISGTPTFDAGSINILYE